MHFAQNGKACLQSRIEDWREKCGQIRKTHDARLGSMILRDDHNTSSPIDTEYHNEAMHSLPNSRK